MKKLIHLAIAIYLLLVMGCVYVPGNGNTTNVSIMIMLTGNTATIPVSALPGLP